MPGEDDKNYQSGRNWWFLVISGIDVLLKNYKIYPLQHWTA
ncbi:MAG: hypothetical protein CI953_1335 [Methanohalophilus sp.]|nr:MAG: hypothetical protein CI953_1335 [Methanohalophilus sp.]